MKQLSVRRAFAPALFVVLAVTACGLDTEITSPYDEDTDPADVFYAGNLVARGVVIDQMTRTETGLYYRDLEEGTGEVAEVGDRLNVGYLLWEPDGELRENATHSLTLGSDTDTTIDGWHEGLEGVAVGGRRLLVIPWWLGYVPPNVPPGFNAYAPLIFEVELLGILDD